MSSVNKVILIGRLGQDPESKTLQSGRQVCTISLATSESWVKDGKREEKTEWHRIVCWEKLAEIAAKYLKKGNSVFFEGKLQTRSWEGQDGQKHYATEVIATNIVFLGGNKDGQSRQNAPSDYGQRQGSQEASYSVDEDVPFN